MLKIRLSRTGRRKRPYYRMVVAEQTAPRDGAFVEIVGHYDPLANPSVVEVKAERVKHWLSHGAQPTETVHRLLAAKDLLPPLQPKPRSKKAEAKRQAREAAAAGGATAGEKQPPVVASGNNGKAEAEASTDKTEGES